MFNNLPNDIKRFPQWVLWKYEVNEKGKTQKRPYSITGYPASIYKPQGWSTFDECYAVGAKGGYDGMGFMLTDDDPFTIIDLDDPFKIEDGKYKFKVEDDTPDQPNEAGQALRQDLFDQMHSLMQYFDSYTEISPSGKGYHIIVTGATPVNLKRDNVEVYSRLRFMTMTGNFYSPEGYRIIDGQQGIDWLYSKMSTRNQQDYDFEDMPEEMTDDEVLDKLYQFHYEKDTFRHLFEDEIEGNASSLDQALMNCIAIGTKNCAQACRIFKRSVRGKRDKANRVDYLPRTYARARDELERATPDVDISRLREKWDAYQQQIAKREHAAVAETVGTPAYTPAYVPMPDNPPMRHHEDGEPETAPILPPDPSVYQRPPGLVGQIADYIYHASPYPYPEVSLIAALGLMSGICGRAFNVSRSGLNQYFVLLAPSGAGKEALSSGISNLMTQVARQLPGADLFIGPSRFASAPALFMHLSKHPSFVSVLGEFWQLIRNMSRPNAPPNLQELKSEFLNLYGKGGYGQSYAGSVSADRSKNIEPIDSPAFSFIGESTQYRYFESISEELIAEGFIPRLLHFDCVSEIALELNKNPVMNVSDALMGQMLSLVQAVMNIHMSNKPNTVGYGYGVEDISTKYAVECRRRVAAMDESNPLKPIWTRAHLKVLKLAALVAVGCNAYEPKIDFDIWEWARRIVERDISLFSRRFDMGEIGGTDSERKQAQEVVRVIAHWLNSPWSMLEKYKSGSVGMHSERIIPLGYIQRRLLPVAAFRTDKAGANNALGRTLRMLIDGGDLIEVRGREEVKRELGMGRAFMVNNPSIFR